MPPANLLFAFVGAIDLCVAAPYFGDVYYTYASSFVSERDHNYHSSLLSFSQSIKASGGGGSAEDAAALKAFTGTVDDMF